MTTVSAEVADVPKFGEPLPCPLCGQTIQRGEWFILASQAIEPLQTGTPYESAGQRYVPQRGIHVTCLAGGSRA